MLLIDANILVRCSQGRARPRLLALQARDIRLAVTDRVADEFGRTLIRTFGWTEDDAWQEVDRVLAAIDVLPSAAYDHRRELAGNRLGEGGKSDWPTVAAALALDADIWSDDRDFFGVGVPVWSTHNVHLSEAEGA